MAVLNKFPPPVHSVYVASLILGPGFSFGKFYFFHFALCILIASSLHTSFFRKLFRYQNLSLCIYLLLAWSLLSIIWSKDQLLSLVYLYYLFTGIVVVQSVAALCSNVFIFRRVIALLGLLFCIILAISVLEIFTPLRWPWSPFSEYAHLFNRGISDGGTLFLNPTSTSTSLPPTVFWGNTNTLSVVLLMGLPFALMTYKISIVLPVSSFAFLSIIAAQSRAALIGGFLSVLMCVIFAPSFNLAYLLIFLPFLALLFLLFPEYTNSFLEEVARPFSDILSYIHNPMYTGDSLSIRYELLAQAFQTFIDSSLIGTGAGTSLLLDVNGIAAVHNFWFELLMEGGLPAVALFLLFNYLILSRLFRIFKQSALPYQTYCAGSLFISILVFTFSCISASTVIYLLPMWLLYGLAISFISIQRQSMASQI